MDEQQLDQALNHIMKRLEHRLETIVHEIFSDFEERLSRLEGRAKRANHAATPEDENPKLFIWICNDCSPPNPFEGSTPTCDRCLSVNCSAMIDELSGKHMTSDQFPDVASSLGLRRAA